KCRPRSPRSALLSLAIRIISLRWAEYSMRRYSYSTKAPSGSRDSLNSVASALPSARQERAFVRCSCRFSRPVARPMRPPDVDLDYDRAIGALIADEIDVAIFPSQLDTGLLRRALAVPDVRLMNVAQAEAIAKTVPGIKHVVLWQGLIDLTRD